MTSLNIPINLDNAHGVSMCYPLRIDVMTYQTYTHRLTFAADTRWDEFVVAVLAEQPFDSNEPSPNPVPPLPLGYRVFLLMIRR